MNQYHQFIGDSPSMQKVYQTIAQIAQSDVSVLITGETGTGKELCAKAIHHQSPRQHKALLTLNCATLPHHLLESELFGHVKGAFTSAIQEKTGIAQVTNQGSLFLDEIGEMNFDLQSKLLRFIETGTFYPVGSHQLETVDIRFIAATNRDPQFDIEVGRFRSDLYYRLKTIAIHLPPLRERGQDVLLLAKKFIHQFAQKEQKHFQGFTTEAEKILLSYHWPGNVRQLQNVIHSLVLLNEGEKITASMLFAELEEQPQLHKIFSNYPSQLTLSANAVSPSISAVTIMSGDTIYPFWQIEREVLLKVIDYCEGHVAYAADLLEVSYTTIYRKLRAWNIPLKQLKKAVRKD